VRTSVPAGSVRPPSSAHLSGLWSGPRIRLEDRGGLALTTEQHFEGTALGDQIVFTTQLLKGDTEVGHQGGVCTVTSAVRAEAQCLATYVLPGGQITGQALIVLGDPAPYAVAITGGSGKYKGVEGEIRVDPASETQPRGVLTFHLRD
jgi:hypothetical protein